MIWHITRLYTSIPGYISIAGSDFSQEQTVILVLIVGLTICLATLVNTNFGLSVLVFSMLLSPEIEVAQLAERAVTIRVEDFLIGIVFFTWLAKMALLKEVGLLRHSILNRAILLYITICVFSTLFARQLGKLRGGYGPYFFVLKYIEYFVVYFMFFNNATSKEQIQRFLTFFLFTGLCVFVFALVQGQSGLYGRLGAPFEGDRPEPGSLGGYLLVQIGAMLGLLLHSDWPRHRVVLFGLLALAIVTLILSTSRGALLALGPLYLMTLFVSPKRRALLIIALVAGLFLGYMFIPPRIFLFIRQAFSTEGGGAAYTVGGHEVELGPSGVARLDAWRHVTSMWTKRPILGYGVCGVGIVDSQYVRTLGEVGVVGITVFVWLLFLIFKVGFAAYRSQDPLTKGLGAGLIIVHTGLLFQGMSANSYIIVRIMEPFWFLVAVTLGMTRLGEEASEKKEETLKVKAA